MATLTLTRSIVASADDIAWYGTGTYATAQALTTILIGGVGTPTGTVWGLGFRFINITIPQGSPIVSVRLRVIKSGAQWLTTTDRWTFINSTNCPAFTAGAPAGSLPIVTAAVVEETSNIDDADLATIDLPRGASLQTQLAANLQEVIANPGWVPGSAVGLVDNSAQDVGAFQNFSRKSFYTYDALDTIPGSAAPQLIVEYTADPQIMIKKPISYRPAPFALGMSR